MTSACRLVVDLLLDDVPPGLREALGSLRADHSLVVEGDAFKLVRTTPAAPRLMADRRLIRRPRADIQALAEAIAAAAHGVTSGDLRGRLVLLAGLGDGSAACAVTELGAVSVTVEVDAAAVDSTAFCVTDLTEATRETAAGRSVVLVGNIVAVSEAMVRRGFTPDVLIDLGGDARVPDGYAPRSVQILAERNPLELARVRLQSRERLALAWRTLAERGAVNVPFPRLERVDALENGLHIWRHRSGAMGSLEDAARGAAYVDLAGYSIVVRDEGS